MFDYVRHMYKVQNLGQRRKIIVVILINYAAISVTSKDTVRVKYKVHILSLFFE